MLRNPNHQDNTLTNDVEAQSAPEQDGGASAEVLVTAQRGSLPIVLSAPHGGRVRVPGSPGRTAGVVVRDINTAQLTLLVAQRITERLGSKPSFVIAQFSRRDVDANRPEMGPDGEPAYVGDAAAAQYRAFHTELEGCVAVARGIAAHGALLVDIHGQARVPGAIVRGTNNGESFARAIAVYGREAVVGAKSIFGVLASKGYVVIPELPGAPGGVEARERMFEGGYITRRYGSAHPEGINAVQIELGEMRRTALEQTAIDLGDAIVEHYRAFGSGVPTPPEGAALVEPVQPPGEEE